MALALPPMTYLISVGVAMVAGIVWGSKSGVQFSLSLIALKALPELILGGFTSVPGAIIGGLIIGVGEKVAEIYWGPLFGGAIENWFAYVLALVFLPFRGVLKLRLLRATDERMNGFKAAGLTILAYFGFLAAYVVIARQVGIEKGDLDPDFLGSLMAYVFFAKWPLSSLLNPNGPASEPPASAQDSESPEPT